MHFYWVTEEVVGERERVREKERERESDTERDSERQRGIGAKEKKCSQVDKQINAKNNPTHTQTRADPLKGAD